MTCVFPVGERVSTSLVLPRIVSRQKHDIVTTFTQKLNMDKVVYSNAEKTKEGTMLDYLFSLS